MRRLKPIAGILVVFFLGALAGVMSARFYATFESRKPHHRPKLEERVEFIMKRLTDDLDLSATQQKEIRQIVASTEKKVQSIKDEYVPEIRALHDSSIKEIKTRLAPDQRAELDRLHAEWERRRQDRKSR
jgi:Spy/CpxP family protein refolding chaperone